MGFGNHHCVKVVFTRSDIGAGSCAAAVAKRRLQREHIDATPDRLRCVRVAQLVRMQVHAVLLAPAVHPRWLAVSGGLEAAMGITRHRLR